jgi:hypothetical protein
MIDQPSPAPPVPPPAPPPSKKPVLVFAGLVLGAIGLSTMIPVIIMVTILLPALNAAREKAREVNCISNVHQIGLGCAMYADAHNGSLPQKLDDLTNFVTMTKYFACPSSKDPTSYSYEFAGVTNKWGKDPHVIVLREIEANHRGRRVVLYDDGHAALERDIR